MATDPVCGMLVDERTAPANIEYMGETFFFCSEKCKDDFLTSPESYLDRPAA